jgi:transcriptional regulator with XRE-family HTH domain
VLCLSEQTHSQQTPVYRVPEDSSTPPHKPAFRPIDLREQIVQGLRSLNSERELNDAWLRYRQLVIRARGEDNRRLVKVERVLEHLEEPEPGMVEPIPRRLRLLSEDLKSEFEEAWSRLLGRTLVESLKQSTLSLRTLAEKVGVSAPYLSQLTAGGGPVPSERILAKLLDGHEALELTKPIYERSPKEAFSEIDTRALAVREHLKIAPVGAHRPRITVDHPSNRRLETALKECFEAIAERYVDETEGAVVKELVEILVSSDLALLSSIAWIVRDEQGAVDALRTLRELPPDVRQRFLDLLNSLTPLHIPIDLPNRLAKKEKP